MPDLVVFIEGRRAGEIESGRGSAARFRYDREYLRGARNTPLSLSAPLGHEAAELTGLTPRAVSDAIDSLSARERRSRALPPLHRMVKALADEALGAFAKGRSRRPATQGGP